MMAIYLMVAISPMASAALRSKMVAHAITGECSGDCSICGCSPEARANHTCCCAKKLQAQENSQAHKDDADEPECCKKKHAKTTVIRCGCPCGSGKQAALSIGGTSEVLPYQFTESFILPDTDTTFSNLPHRLTSRYGDPPDPPPKLFIIS